MNCASRKEARFLFPAPFICQKEPELYGTLIDLSMTGALCQIKHKADLPPPQIDIIGGITLRCLMPGIKEEQILSGVVRSLAIDTNETRIGIEFANLQPHLADTIGNYLFALDGLGD